MTHLLDSIACLIGKACTGLLAFVLGFTLLSGAGCAAMPDSNAAAASVSSQASTLSFRSDEKLQQHFEKHGWETGCATAEEYLARANEVIASPEALHKYEKEDGDDVYFLEATGEFVIVSPKGYIRTFYITDKGYFDRQ